MAKKKTSDAGAGTPSTITCESCELTVPAYEVTHVGEGKRNRALCGPCYFATVSLIAGEDISHHRLEPITVRDARGVPHTFHFRYSIIPSGHGLEAFEIVRGNPGGYEFQVGGPQDPMELFKQLYERIKRELSRIHLAKEEGRRELHIKDMEVRALIDCDLDSEDARLPMLIIDGQEITWDKFGRMLMCFEGWRFKMEIYDRSEEK